MLLRSFPEPLPVVTHGAPSGKLPCTRPQIANTVEVSHPCVPPQSHQLTKRIGGEREDCENVSIIGPRGYRVKPNLRKFGVSLACLSCFLGYDTSSRSRNRRLARGCAAAPFGIRIALSLGIWYCVLDLKKRRFCVRDQCLIRNKMRPQQMHAGAWGSTLAREPFWEAFDGHSVVGRSRRERPLQSCFRCNKRQSTRGSFQRLRLGKRFCLPPRTVRRMIEIAL
jgi:hypothetical protein